MTDTDPNESADRPVDTDATREEFLEFFADEPTEYPLYDAGQTSSVFLELPKLELETRGDDPPPLVTDHLDEALSRINNREDCGDFVLTPLLRILYQYPDSELLGDEYRQRIEDAALDYIYWFSEPGEQHMWMTSENHMILLHACELLAGQLFPDEQFTNNGETGEWHRDHAETYVERWLDWRAQFGFSEWNSNCYYDEDLIALLNLAEFAADESIRRKAEGLVDLVLFEIAVNSFDGTFGSAHGRTYDRLLLNPPRENTSPLTYLLWKEGSYEHTLSRSALTMAVSEYRVPSLVQEVALDETTYENLERHSLDVEDAPEYGLDPTDPDDLMFFWSAGMTNHRDVVDTSLEVCPVRYYLKYGSIADAHEYHYRHAEDPGGWTRDRADGGYAPDLENAGGTQADIYTYRTPEYMLSCARDFKKGKRGFQQHIWQATLPGRAVVFATHPGAESIGGRNRPGSWHGNDVLPRSAAHRNVLVSLHRFDTDGVPEPLRRLLHSGTRPDPNDILPYTHAFFPRYAFDEWTEANGWVCGRSDDGYVGIRSLESTRWVEPAEDVVEVLRPLDAGEDWRPGACELRADGTETAWVCELGSERSHGSFDEFVDSLADAELAGDVSDLRYESPSRGTVEFGWNQPFVVDGTEISLDDHPRFDNPYCETEFGSTRYELEAGDRRLDVELGDD